MPVRKGEAVFLRVHLALRVVILAVEVDVVELEIGEFWLNDAPAPLDSWRNWVDTFVPPPFPIYLVSGTAILPLPDPMSRTL